MVTVRIMTLTALLLYGPITLCSHVEIERLQFRPAQQENSLSRGSLVIETVGDTRPIVEKHSSAILITGVTIPIHLRDTIATVQNKQPLHIVILADKKAGNILRIAPIEGKENIISTVDCYEKIGGGYYVIIHWYDKAYLTRLNEGDDNLLLIARKDRSAFIFV